MYSPMTMILYVAIVAAVYKALVGTWMILSVAGMIKMRRETPVMGYTCDQTNLPFLLPSEKAR